MHNCISYRVGSTRNWDLANMMFLPIIPIFNQFQSENYREVTGSKQKSSKLSVILQATRIISRHFTDEGNICRTHPKTRRRMVRERRGAGSSLVSMETPYYKTIY